MLLEYQLDWIKIVDFLLIAKFWASLKFACTPSILFMIFFRFYKQWASFIIQGAFAVVCAMNV